jgi:peptidyl-prolyl cis-trans isomerase D
MLDLFRSRESAMRTLLVVLLSLVALSMVITLIPGFGSPSINTDDDQVIAVVGDQKVMARDIRARVDELTRGQRLPPQMISAYVPQLIDGFIEDRAAGLMSSRIGNIITDDELARVLQSSLPNMFQNGAVDKVAYRNAVQSMGRTVSQFEEDMRTNQLGLRLRDLVEDAAVVAPKDVQAEYNRRNVKLKIDYVSFSAEKLKNLVVPSEADMRALYNNSKSNYPVGEKRDLTVLVADEGQVASQLEMPEADVRALYAKQINNFKTEERVHARHILVSTQGKSDAEKTALKTKADGLLKQVKGGADFAEVAKKNSDDPGSAVKGGDLGWFKHGAMVPVFDTASFSLKPGQISDIVTSEFGYHIIQSMEKEDARIKPFEEVKGQLIADAKRGKVQEMMTQTMEAARAELAKDPSKAEAIAAKYKLQLIKGEKIGSGQPLPILGQAADLTAAAFGVKVQGVTNVTQPQIGKLAVALVTAITPARFAEFEEARDRIKDAFQNVEAQKIAEQKAKEAASKMLVAGSDWKAIAKSLGGELKTSPEFAPDGSIDGLGGASMLGDLLNKPVGASAGPISIVGQWVVARVAERKEPDPAGVEAMRKTIQMNLKQKAATDRYMLMRDSMLNNLIEQGKVKKNKKAIERLIGSYAS